MALIEYTKAIFRNVNSGSQGITFTWANMTGNDLGVPGSGLGFVDASWQVGGDFNGATATIEGSNDQENYFTLVDPFNHALSFIAPGAAQALSTALWIRPRVVGGIAASITVTACHCGRD